jgi:hypothetical protein
MTFTSFGSVCDGGQGRRGIEVDDNDHGDGLFPTLGPDVDGPHSYGNEHRPPWTVRIDTAVTHRRIGVVPGPHWATV